MKIIKLSAMFPQLSFETSADLSDILEAIKEIDKTFDQINPNMDKEDRMEQATLDSIDLCYQTSMSKFKANSDLLCSDIAFKMFYVYSKIHGSFDNIFGLIAIMDLDGLVVSGCETVDDFDDARDQLRTISYELEESMFETVANILH